MLKITKHKADSQSNNQRNQVDYASEGETPVIHSFFPSPMAGPLADFPNGLGGIALLGTFSTALTACWKRAKASVPSCIGACGFSVFMSCILRSCRTVLHMPTIHYTGKVLPEFAGFATMRVPQINLTDTVPVPGSPSGHKAVFRVSVTDGIIDVECQVEPYVAATAELMFYRAMNIASSIVDLHCFSTGSVYTVFFDSITDPNGVKTNVLVTGEGLNGLSTVTDVLSQNGDGRTLDVGRILPVLISQTEAALALRDLISAIAYPQTAAIECARAIEGMRNALHPHSNDRAAGWGKFQEALKVSRSYREFVTNASRGPRHGDWSSANDVSVNEVTNRSWKIMNRFLEYLLRGSVGLPPDEFPEL